MAAGDVEGDRMSDRVYSQGSAGTLVSPAIGVSSDDGYSLVVFHFFLIDIEGWREDLMGVDADRLLRSTPLHSRFMVLGTTHFFTCPQAG